jgi:hypothetical protein
MLIPDTRVSGHFLAGAVAFAAAQAVLFLVAEPPARDVIDGEGWFLNSGTGIAVMAVVLVAASLVMSRALPAPLWQRWALFAGGGIAALVGAVFLFGPGTLFPIVIVAGAAVIAVSALLGVWGARLFG